MSLPPNSGHRGTRNDGQDAAIQLSSAQMDRVGKIGDIANVESSFRFYAFVPRDILLG